MSRRESFDSGHGMPNHSAEPEYDEVFYHATNPSLVKSILEKGLEPNNPTFDDDWVDDEHPPGVYLTETLDEALEWGDAVLAVKSRWKDVAHNRTADLHSKDPIPPHRISVVSDTDLEEARKRRSK